jgi:hypothetical protein
LEIAEGEEHFLSNFALFSAKIFHDLKIFVFSSALLSEKHTSLHKLPPPIYETLDVFSSCQ